MPIWPGASSVASNSASASADQRRGRARGRRCGAASTPRLPSVMPTPLRSPSSRRSASASSSHSRAELVIARGAGEGAEPVQRKGRAHRVARVAEVGQALGQALARRLAESLGPRDVAERGEDVADRAPRVHAAKELHGLLEATSAALPPGPSPATKRPTVWTRKKRSAIVRRGSRAAGSGCRAAPRGRPRSRRANGRAGRLECGRPRPPCVAELLSQRAALGVEQLGGRS